MQVPDDDPWAGRWKFAAWMIVVCWVLSMLSILSWLLLLLLAFALWRTSRRGAWRPAACILLANPLGFWFIEGTVDYFRGAPTIRGMGLPSMESYNIDPITRGFPRSGGCLVSGNEWVPHGSHNLGVLAMRAVFGPPSRSYDGPYPTEDEALQTVADTPKLDLKEFLKGHVSAGGRHVELDPEMIRSFASSLGIYPLMAEEFMDEDAGIFAQAAIYRNRCLILRIVEPDTMPPAPGPRDRDFIILIDLNNLRPFAYYEIKGYSLSRRPKLQYLPELSR